MNSFLTNQLEDVKNDLKEMDTHITCPYCNVKLVAYAEGQRAKCKNNKCKGETKDYPLNIMSIIELNTKIKTKLQKYHEWASEMREDKRNLISFFIITRYKDELEQEELEEKELSTFILEVEKLAKASNIDLSHKSYSDKDNGVELEDNISQQTHDILNCDYEKENSK